MNSFDPKPRAIPSGRLTRMARLGRMTAGIAGSALGQGARQLAQGQRPRLPDLFLTPANARRLADELSKMRGAAMKVGQLLSMEASDLLPPEMAEILGSLRSSAHTMPPKQLKQVLTAEWGRDFLRHFKRFDTTPIAAASIGQVHHAVLKDGREVAVKVQYPGVRGSIDSDVKNVGALIRLSGQWPRGIALDPLLEEARAQLHEEADYEQEAAHLTRFRALLAGDHRFQVPALFPDLTTQNILVMEYLQGRPIETAEEGARVMTALVDLFLQELFQLGWMQTDPNFANYRIGADGRIQLLDFGATRPIPDWIRDGARALMVVETRDQIEAELVALRLFDADPAPHHRETVIEMTFQAHSKINAPFDFATDTLIAELRDKGMDLANDGQVRIVPPVPLLFVQRKMGGLYLLGVRLGAKIDLPALIAPYRG